MFTGYLFAIVGITVSLMSYNTNVCAQRMTIQPSTVSVGGGSSSGTSAPATNVVMQCSPEGIGLPIEQIYSMYIRRNSVAFAEISNGNTAKFSANAPSDIKTKAPTLEGSVVSNSASLLKATFLNTRMDCMDAATYECVIYYKPVSYETTKASAETTLSVNVLPRDLQISAGMNQNNGIMPIQNQSVVNTGQRVEVTCSGFVGSSQATLMEWFRKVPPSLFFQRFYPQQAGDSIDDGNPSQYQCEYMRTSKLLFTMSSADRTGMAFRCEVAAQITSGAQQRIYSQEFHISSGISPNSGLDKFAASKEIVVAVLLVSYLALSAVF